MRPTVPGRGVAPPTVAAPLCRGVPAPTRHQKHQNEAKRSHLHNWRGQSHNHLSFKPIHNHTTRKTIGFVSQKQGGKSNPRDRLVYFRGPQGVAKGTERSHFVRPTAPHHPLDCGYRPARESCSELPLLPRTSPASGGPERLFQRTTPRTLSQQDIKIKRKIECRALAPPPPPSRLSRRSFTRMRTCRAEGPA